MVFQHGEALDDYWRAHELAKNGAELGHHGARWLAAAAYDRWLMRQGKPQKYGTQYVREGERWRLRDVDPATTDEERGEWNVPPLAEALQRAEEMTRTRPPQTCPTRLNCCAPRSVCCPSRFRPPPGGTTAPAKETGSGRSRS